VTALFSLLVLAVSALGAPVAHAIERHPSAQATGATQATKTRPENGKANPGAPRGLPKGAPTQVVKKTADQAASTAATRSEPFAGRIVAKIDIRGNKRIEKDAILGKVISKPGQLLSPDEVRADIQGIFAMGFFDDIEVSGEAPEPSDTNRVNLIYTVRERPVISKIDFEGNERIGTSDLKEVTKVKEYSILDINKVREDVALLQKHYEDKGFYLAKVTFEVKTLKPDEVQLTYKVNDYDKVQIKKITFLNNRRFTDDQLKGVFQETKEGNLLSFMNSSGNFKESAFKNDLQRLTYWYLDNGYVKFRYENPVVTVSDDKRFLYISIYVDEGDQYKIGNIDFGGDLLFSKEELHQELTLKSDETFSITRRNADIQKLTEKYQDLGYAFVNVIPDPNPALLKDDAKTIDLIYNFEKGNLVYFGEINVTGNSKTHDKVIRRELRIHEGELYSGSALRISRENVERLGYFAPGEVIFNSVTPKGKNDTVNIDITVKERSTGTITLGAGYGSVQGFFFTSTISEINFLGRGQTLSFSAQYSRDSSAQSLNLGFTDPYAFDTRWSLGGDVFRVIFPVPNTYTTYKSGFDVRAGYPLREYTYGYVTYKFESLQLRNEFPGVPADRVAADNGILSSVVLSTIRDKRNNRFETTGGNYQSASLETAGVGGDKKFFKATANNRFYTRLIGDLVFRTSAEVGGMGNLSDSRPLPPSEKFYLGGPNNMKGYQLFQLGPKTINGNSQPLPLGGVFEGYSLFELEYPLIKEAGLKWVMFFDAGNCWDQVPALDYLTLRTDAGFGLRWFSPIGPLRFEWGFPFARRPGEDSMVFQFFIGPPF
jgi:outer membrane protein insertion porin family